MSQAKKRSLVAVLRPLFAVVLLGFVAYSVPWRDRLLWTDPASGRELGVAGRILGDWRADEVRFAVAPEEEIEPSWPPEVAADLARGEPIVLSRTALGPLASTTHEWRPGMINAFRELQAKWLWLAMALFLAAAATSITRWWRLLSIAGCPTTWMTAMRLTFLGFFFNLVVPGLTGGDVIKAVLVVRENPSRRADALVSVIVDRGIGLVVLVGLAACVVLFSEAHFEEVRAPVVLTFLGMTFALWLAIHSGPRRWLRIDKLLARAPQKERLQSLDRALRLYADHPLEMAGACVLSALNHAFIAAGIMFIGIAFGDTLDWIEYLGITAIANTVSSLPVAPAGWGVGEATFGYLFHLLGSAASLGVAVSVTYRLLMMALGLAGGVFLLMPGARGVREELEAESA